MASWTAALAQSPASRARAGAAAKYESRAAEARKALTDLKACAERMSPGPARRASEKAITNLDSARARSGGLAARGAHKRAFLALGRPLKAAQAALKRCSNLDSKRLHVVR